MDIVKVEWIDSSSDTGRWTLADEIDNDILHCVSFGILVKETEEQITLALNGIQEPEQYCQMISIPKCAIKKLSQFNPPTAYGDAKIESDKFQSHRGEF